MRQEDFLTNCHRLTGSEPAEAPTPDSLIGFFQCFRPDGKAVEAIFSGLENQVDLVTRIRELYTSAGNDRRPNGGRDAYFMVRRPLPTSADAVEKLGNAFVEGLRQLAQLSEMHDMTEPLRTEVKIRVLEGIPPKHPKNKAEHSKLLECVRHCSTITDGLDTNAPAMALRDAYYFIACDPLLRDYMMWPFFRAATKLEDPLLAYFQLWQCGVKYRIFEESQIDLYLPRQLSK